MALALGCRVFHKLAPLTSSGNVSFRCSKKALACLGTLGSLDDLSALRSQTDGYIHAPRPTCSITATVSKSSLNIWTQVQVPSSSPSLNSVPPFNIRRDNTIRAATNLAYQVLHLRRRHAGQGEHETRLPHISASTPIIAMLINGISPTSLLSYRFPALCHETPVLSQLYLIRSSRLPLLGWDLEICIFLKARLWPFLETPVRQSACWTGSLILMFKFTVSRENASLGLGHGPWNSSSVLQSRLVIQSRDSLSIL